MPTALLIIDVQRALAEGEYKTLDVEGVIDRLNAVSALARSANIPIYFVQHESQGPLMARGSVGWEFAVGLVRTERDTVVPKGTPDSFHGTDLAERLASRGIAHLVVGGIQSDFCVDTSIRRALALGYEVTLLSDGHTTLGNGVLSAEQIIAHHNKTLSSMSSFGPRVELKRCSEMSFSAG